MKNSLPPTLRNAPLTQCLKQKISIGEISPDNIWRFTKLEQYILYGVESFGPGSIVIQGRGLDTTIKCNRDLYIAMVRELKGEESVKETEVKKNHYMTAEPMIFQMNTENGTGEKQVQEFAKEVYQTIKKKMM